MLFTNLMAKKLLVILFSLFFLVACGKKEISVPDGFKGPTSAPDPSKLMPTYGPNDPVPASVPANNNGSN